MSNLTDLVTASTANAAITTVAPTADGDGEAPAPINCTPVTINGTSTPADDNIFGLHSVLCQSNPVHGESDEDRCSIDVCLDRTPSGVCSAIAHSCPCN